MPKITIDLSTEEKEALDEILGKKTLQKYVQEWASSHIGNNLDEEFKKKSIEDKKKLLEE